MSASNFNAAAGDAATAAAICQINVKNWVTKCCIMLWHAMRQCVCQQVAYHWRIAADAIAAVDANDDTNAKEAKTITNEKNCISLAMILLLL